MTNWTGFWTPSRPVTFEDVERAKPMLQAALSNGQTKVRVGWFRRTVWRFVPIDHRGGPYYGPVR